MNAKRKLAGKGDNEFVLSMLKYFEMSKWRCQLRAQSSESNLDWEDEFVSQLS